MAEQAMPSATVSRSEIGTIVARRFRIWVKKQGERTTGAQRLGEWGETAFFAVLFLLGLSSLIYLATAQWFVPQTDVWRVGHGWWLVVLVLASFIVLGGRGLAVSLLKLQTSEERRAALMRDAARLRVLPDDEPARPEYPAIPRGLNLANSPGVRQPFRLPVANTPAWELLVAASFCIVWNGVTLFLIREVWHGYSDGHPDRTATIALVPFLAIGTWALIFLIRQIARQVRVGPTLVEISQHPVAPGIPFCCFIAQAGRAKLKDFAVHLVCVEETTCHQGTDIRIDRQVVFNEVVKEERDLTVNSGQPLEVEVDCQVPTGAMHSFQSHHNGVAWKVVVRGTPERGESFEHPFPLIVVPESASLNHDGTAY